MTKIKQIFRKTTAQLFVVLVMTFYMSTTYAIEAVTGVSFNPNSGIVKLNSTLQLSPIIAPATATNKGVKFTSNLASVAPVDSITGLVTGSRIGSAIITVKTQDGNFKADYTVNVYTETLTLPSVLGSNMVMQQNTQAALWGWTAPKTNVKITASWGEIVNIVADSIGKWSTKIQTPKAVAGANQTKHTLTFVGKNNTISLSNILIGDVYLCSGQSNMGYGMNGVLNSEIEIAAANYPNIRLNKANYRGEQAPYSQNVSNWKECNPTNVKDFSGVAYYFARHLHNNPNINIPIGVIAAAVGGSTIQSWMSREALSADPELKSKVLDATTSTSSQYNGMIASCIPFSISGFLWYQGEANNSVATYSELYGKLLTTLITSRRAEWGQGNLPFYFVQLPAYKWFLPEFRDQFSNTLTVPNTGMAVTLDLADDDLSNIHPQNKLDVGIRLAKIAEANIYKQNVVFSGPMLDTFMVEGTKIRIKYHALSLGTGLMSKDGKALSHFQIAGSDNVFVAATAVIDGNDILVSAASVSSPKNVAFAYSSTAIPNLYNKEGLLACPFRTDRWNYSIVLGTDNISSIKNYVGEKLKVFPVPASDKINISIATGTILKSYTITELSGKVQKQNNLGVIDGDLSIDVSELTKGYYILQLRAESFTQAVSFIKN